MIGEIGNFKYVKDEKNTDFINFLTYDWVFSVW